MIHNDYYLQQQQALLDTCKDRLSMLDAADLALDNKLMALVGLSSLSVSLVTLALAPPGHISTAASWLVVCGFGLLIVIVLLALYAWHASGYPIPAKLDIPPEEINERYVIPDPGTVYSHLTADYLEVTKDRKESTIRKAAVLNSCVGLYAVQLLLLTSAVAAGLGLMNGAAPLAAP